MPRRRPETAEAALAAMCSDMERRTVRSPRTIRFYREEVSTIIKVLRAGDRHTLPWEIDEADVRWLLDHYIERHLTVIGFCHFSVSLFFFRHTTIGQFVRLFVAGLTRVAFNPLPFNIVRTN